MARRRFWPRRLDAGLEAGQKPQELDFTGFERYREACVQLLEMRRKYLGQMDLNLKSERVWAYYDSVLGKLAEYGAAIVRLDAFAYAPKTPGAAQFYERAGHVGHAGTAFAKWPIRMV